MYVWCDESHARLSGHQSVRQVLLCVGLAGRMYTINTSQDIIERWQKELEEVV